MPAALSLADALAPDAGAWEDPQSGLRLLPVPQSAPPYDDELPVAPELRLLPPLRRTRTEPTRPLRATPGSGPGTDLWQVAGRTPLAALPPARPVAQLYVQGLMEVLAGLRPVSQLRMQTHFELYADLIAIVARRGRIAGSRPTGRTVRTVHVQERSEGVAEVCATVVRAGRPTALGLRFEGKNGRWLCTEIAGL